MYLLNVLAYYHDQCKMGGADENHLTSIQLLHQRVSAFQNKHGSKLPDTDLPCEIDRCIKGKI